MDLTAAIAASSSMTSLAQAQMAAATKVLKLSQTAAAEPVVALLDAAFQNMQDTLEAMAGGLGQNLNALA